MNTALSQWRILGAFLLNSARSQRNVLVASKASLSTQINGLKEALNAFLKPFIPPESGQQQSVHLEAVIFECTKFGYSLISQPADWKVNLSVGSQSAGYQRLAVVCAGLEKLTTNDGKAYGMPNSVVPPTLVAVQ